MAILVLDPGKQAQLLALWTAEGDVLSTEVWDGVTVFNPLYDNHHQAIRGILMIACMQAVEDAGEVRMGVNLSDRAPNWEENYRCPDVVVFLHSSHAVCHDMFWMGGPDFVAEVISPGETPSARLGFYESIATREVLIVHRQPWRLDLFVLTDNKLELAGSSVPTSPDVCTSAALGLTFRLVPEAVRPKVVITHPATGRTRSV